MQEQTELAAGGRKLSIAQRVWRCVVEAGVKALRTAGWLIAIMLPINLAVTLLQHYGVLEFTKPALEPVFRVLGLPAESVLACISAAMLNIYSGIAALGAIPLTDRQVTILAIMMLVAHNVPTESAIQHKAGTPMWRTALLRVVVALAAGLAFNLLLPAGDVAAKVRGVAQPAAEGLWLLLGGWAWGMTKLSAMICGIVISLMILQRLLREFKVMELLAVPLWPLLRLLGLPRRTAFLWIVANVVGLSYGSAIILDDVAAGTISHKDAQLLNRSVAVCHSLLEDTLILVAVGAWGLWITVPRLIMAAMVVWCYKALMAIRRTA